MTTTSIESIRNSADALLNDAETAALLGLKSAVTLRVWRSQRRGPPWVKFEGDAVRYQRTALIQYIARNTVAPKAKAV